MLRPRTCRFFEGTGAATVETMSLAALAVEDELIEGADGLWDGRSSIGLTGIEGEGFALGRLDVVGNFEDFDRDLILQTRGDFGAFTEGMGGPDGARRRSDASPGAGAGGDQRCRSWCRT